MSINGVDDKNINDLYELVLEKRITILRDESSILFDITTPYKIKLHFDNLNKQRFFSLYFNKGLGDYGSQTIEKIPLHNYNNQDINNCDVNNMYKEVRIGDKIFQDVEYSSKKLLGFSNKNYNGFIGFCKWDNGNNQNSIKMNIYNNKETINKYDLIYISKYSDTIDHIFGKDIIGIVNNIELGEEYPYNISIIYKKQNINNDDSFVIFNGMLTSELPIRCSSYPEYISLHIDEIPRYKSISDVNTNAFAIIPINENILDLNCGNDTFLKIFKPPLASLDKLTIKFKNIYNDLCDFQGKEHFFILSIKY